MSRNCDCDQCVYMADMRERPNRRGRYYCRHLKFAGFPLEDTFIGEGDYNTHHPKRRTTPNFCPFKAKERQQCKKK